MVRVQIQLTEDQDRQLSELAADTRVSKAGLVREAVTLLLRQRVRGPSERERRLRALDIIGMVQGGPSDLAARHDYYLYQPNES